MNSDKEPAVHASLASNGKWLDREPETKEWVPLSVREARRARIMRENLWPDIWISSASIIILAAALAILTYRMGVQGPH